jgi:ankyrin repeat protein
MDERLFKWHVTFGNIHTAEFLLSRGADVHARDTMGQTALHKAAGGTGLESNQLKLVMALLDHGIDPSARDLEGKNAGQIAGDKGRLAIARLLRNRRYVLNRRDELQQSSKYDSVV